MKTVGIIAEFNPFHHGHKYIMEEAKKRAKADYVIIAMSGNFVQRGEPALVDKYFRTSCALACGADAVFEIPVRYACGSASYFAQGTVSLLEKLHVVDTLAFGCETDDVELIMQLSDAMFHETETMSDHVQAEMKQGVSYPKARANALLATHPELTDKYDSTLLEDLLASPNMILALEYRCALLAMDADCELLPIKRVGVSHDSQDILQEGNISYASASYIREQLLKEQSCGNLLPEPIPTDLPLLTMEDFYPYLQYALWEHMNHLTIYADCNEDLANRIGKTFMPNMTYSQLVDALVTRQFTRARVQRVLLHILLQIRESEYPKQNDSQTVADTITHARLLGFREVSTELLHAIKVSSEIPMVTRVLDAPPTPMLVQDVQCTHLYFGIQAGKSGKAPQNEFLQGVIRR